MVVLFHFHPNTHFAGNALVRHSYLFVDFFFVLSGFVIFEAYSTKLQQGFGVFRFIGLRLGRLYPLHVSVLLCFLLYEVAWALVLSDFSLNPRPAFTGSFSPAHFLSSLFLTGSFVLNGWNFPSWSISAEFWTYLIFAAAIVSIKHYVKSTVVVLSLFGFLVSIAVGETIGDETIFLPRCIYGFGLGALLSLAKSNLIMSRPMATTFETLIAISCVVLIYYGGSNRVSFAAPVIFALTVWLFAQERGLLSRLLLTAGPKALGRMSYSIYMVQILVIVITANCVTLIEYFWHRRLTVDVTVEDASVHKLIGTTQFMGDAAYLGQLAIVILVASIFFRFVERPFRDFSRQLLVPKHLEPTLQNGTESGNQSHKSVGKHAVTSLPIG